MDSTLSSISQLKGAFSFFSLIFYLLKPLTSLEEARKGRKMGLLSLSGASSQVTCLDPSPFWDIIFSFFCSPVSLASPSHRFPSSFLLPVP